MGNGGGAKGWDIGNVCNCILAASDCISETFPTGKRVGLIFKRGFDVGQPVRLWGRRHNPFAQI